MTTPGLVLRRLVGDQYPGMSTVVAHPVSSDRIVRKAGRDLRVHHPHLPCSRSSRSGIVLVGYGAGVHEPGIGDPDSNLEGGLGPVDEQLLRITARVAHDTGTALVLTVAGEIDSLTVDQLRAAVAAGFDDLGDGEILVIDLTGVSFMDSRGLQVLVDVTQAAQRQRELLRIVVDHVRPVIRPIEVTGLDEVLALFDSIEDALHASS